MAGRTHREQQHEHKQQQDRKQQHLGSNAWYVFLLLVVIGQLSLSIISSASTKDDGIIRGNYGRRHGHSSFWFQVPILPSVTALQPLASIRRRLANKRRQRLRSQGQLPLAPPLTVDPLLRTPRDHGNTTGSTRRKSETETEIQVTVESPPPSPFYFPRAPKMKGLRYGRLIGLMKAFQIDAAHALLVHADYCRQHNLPGLELDIGIGGKFLYVVDPTVIREVMTDKGRESHKEGIFFKSALDRRGVGLMTGEGSLLTDGPDHTRKRRLILPSLNDRGNLQTFLQIMVDVSLEYANKLSTESQEQEQQEQPSSEPGTVVVNVGELMAAIAMKIVGLALFSTDVVDAKIYQDIAVCLEHVVYVTRNPLALPGWIPTRRNRKFQKALRRLDDLVYSFIAAGQQSLQQQQQRQGVDAHNGETATPKSDKKNLLKMLLAARYETIGDTEASSPSSSSSSSSSQEGTTTMLTEQELRDEVITLFLAGHETTAISLCWTLWYLSDPHNMHWQDAIAKEYQAIHNSRNSHTSNTKEGDDNTIGYTPAIIEDADALQTTRAVLCEALRLRTPSYGLDREVQQDVSIPIASLSSSNTSSTRVWQLKKKDLLIISFLALHLNPDHFENPHHFDPTRFLNFDREPGQDLWDGPFDRSIYLPFGSGRKRCIGYKFAQWESLVILGTLLSHFRVKRPPGVDTVEWEAGVTLRPDRALELVFESRPTNAPIEC